MRRMALVCCLLGSAAFGETFVVAVGVQEYQDENIPGLRYAVADATAIGEAFVSGGVPAGNVTVLASPAAGAAQPATKINVFKALQRAVERARTADTVVFFFAGHGLESAGATFLLPADTYRLTLAATAMAMADINLILEPLEAKQLVFLLDSCRNDPSAARADADAALSDGLARNLRPLFTGPVGQAPRGALLLACDVGQRAWEMPAEQHGAFTYWLLRGFQEAARPDGEVSLKAVAEYVQREVPAWARRTRKVQEPRFDNPADLDFVLLRRPPAPVQSPVQTPVQPPVQPPTPPAGPGQRPANWPDYLRDFQPPEGLGWQAFRVSPKDNMPQVLIPAGEFLMGSPDSEPDRDGDEGPQKRVYVSAFWMDVHEVTVGQYQQFCRATGHEMDTEWNQASTHPVVGVSWEDATAYAQWAGRELPTEAQWEKAARGGTTSAYPWGAAANPAMANGDWQGTRGGSVEDFRRFYQAVGGFPVNAFGLHDMIGNVWEWCRDAYDADWYGRMPARDPFNTGNTNSPRVLRGGSWFGNPVELRVANRGRYDPGGRFNYHGFRCSEAP